MEPFSEALAQKSFTVANTASTFSEGGANAGELDQSLASALTASLPVRYWAALTIVQPVPNLLSKVTEAFSTFAGSSHIERQAS